MCRKSVESAGKFTGKIVAIKRSKELLAKRITKLPCEHDNSNK